MTDIAADEVDPSIGTGETHRRPSWKVMIPALLAGFAVMGIGVRAALADSTDAHPIALGVHLVAFDVAHDVVVAPVALLLGVIIGRLVPVRYRGPVRMGAACSALAVAFSYPLVRRWGHRPGNPSTLPLPYGRNLVIVLAVIWSTVAIVAARRAGSTRRAERS